MFSYSAISDVNMSAASLSLKNEHRIRQVRSCKRSSSVSAQPRNVVSSCRLSDAGARSNIPRPANDHTEAFWNGYNSVAADRYLLQKCSLSIPVFIHANVAFMYISIDFKDSVSLTTPYTTQQKQVLSVRFI